MGSRKRSKGREQSVEDWLAEKLTFELDDPDAEAPTEEPEVVEPSLPWPDWQPDPLPEFEDPLDRSSPGRSARTPTVDPPSEHTMDLVGEETRPAPDGLQPMPDHAGAGLPTWGAEDTSVLLSDTPPGPPPREAAPPPAALAPLTPPAGFTDLLTPPPGAVTRPLPEPEEDEQTIYAAETVIDDPIAPIPSAGPAPTVQLPDDPTIRPEPPVRRRIDRSNLDARTIGSTATHRKPPRPSPRLGPRPAPTSTMAPPSPMAVDGWFTTDEDVNDAPTVASTHLDEMRGMPGGGPRDPEVTAARSDQDTAPPQAVPDRRNATAASPPAGPFPLDQALAPPGQTPWAGPERARTLSDQPRDDEDDADAPTMMGSDPLMLERALASIVGDGQADLDEPTAILMPKAPDPLRQSQIPTTWGEDVEDLRDAPTVALPTTAEQVPSTWITGDDPTRQIPVSVTQETRGVDQAPPTTLNEFSKPDDPEPFLFGANDEAPLPFQPTTRPSSTHEGPRMSTAMIAWTGASVGVLVFLAGLTIFMLGIVGYYGL